MTQPAADPLDALYAAPPADFVATRKRLAAEQAKAGDKQAAAAIKQAQKPSTSAWAVNQAVRRADDAVADLMRASDELVLAQLRAGENRDRFQSAMAGHRKVVEVLTDVAARALGEGGQNVTPALRERIAGNFRWGALSEEHRPLLVAGRLVKDVPAQDFSALARKAGVTALGGRPNLKLVPLTPERPARAHKAADTAASAAERRAAEVALRRERRARLDELRAEWREAKEQTRKADKTHERAAAELERRRGELAERKQQLARAEQAFAEAEREEGTSKKGLDAAEKLERMRGQAVADGEEELAALDEQEKRDKHDQRDQRDKGPR